MMDVRNVLSAIEMEYPVERAASIGSVEQRWERMADRFRDAYRETIAEGGIRAHATLWERLTLGVAKHGTREMYDKLEDKVLARIAESRIAKVNGIVSQTRERARAAENEYHKQEGSYHELMSDIVTALSNGAQYRNRVKAGSNAFAELTTKYNEAVAQSDARAIKPLAGNLIKLRRHVDEWRREEGKCYIEVRGKTRMMRVVGTAFERADVMHKFYQAIIMGLEENLGLLTSAVESYRLFCDAASIRDAVVTSEELRIANGKLQRSFRAVLDLANDTGEVLRNTYADGTGGKRSAKGQDDELDRLREEAMRDYEETISGLTGEVYGDRLREEGKPSMASPRNPAGRLPAAKRPA